MWKASGMKVQEILQKGEKIVNQGKTVIRAAKVEKGGGRGNSEQTEA
jgi:hypothetical protein